MVEKPENSPFLRILGFNLLALLLAALVLRLLNLDKESAKNYVGWMAIGIVVQMLVNVGMAFTAHETAAKQAHWLSVLLVLLIGFGACAGGVELYR